jgi:hypothetical protein
VNKQLIQKQFLLLFSELLDNDTGLPESAYYSLLGFAESIGVTEQLPLERVDATDGMFYLQSKTD